MKISIVTSMLALVATIAAAQTPVAVPSELTPPASYEVFLKTDAAGTQNYICLPSGTAMKWTFLGPQATLVASLSFSNYELKLPVATHFLSPNPEESGTARATWQSTNDTASVWARAIVTVTDANVVAPGSIPWLLLEVVGRQPGLESGSDLSQAKYIQRINTSGGVAPATGCSAMEDAGRVAFVPYTTSYYFFRKGKGSN